MEDADRGCGARRWQRTAVRRFHTRWQVDRRHLHRPQLNDQSGSRVHCGRVGQRHCQRGAIKGTARVWPGPRAAPGHARQSELDDVRTALEAATGTTATSTYTAVAPGQRLQAAMRSNLLVLSSCCNNPPSGQDRGICLGNKARPITNCSEVPHVERHSALPLPASTSVAGSLHFAVSLGVAGSPIDIAKTPAIDCNGSASCSFLGASPDLSMVLVNAAASAPGGACALQPMDPLRWGIALLRNGQSWPPAYSTAWAQCSTANNAKQLTAVRLTTRDTRVLAIFAHVTPGTMDVVGVEACSYDAVDGAELWCTPQLRCAGGSTLPAVNALSEDDHFVFHMASVGLLVVDAASREAPPIELLYGSGAVDDCCSATALAVAHGVAVASIPDGTFNPPWCSCQHSKLIGVALPTRS